MAMLSEDRIGGSLVIIVEHEEIHNDLEERIPPSIQIGYRENCHISPFNLVNRDHFTQKVFAIDRK